MSTGSWRHAPYLRKSLIQRNLQMSFDVPSTGLTFSCHSSSYHALFSVCRCGGRASQNPAKQHRGRQFVTGTNSLKAGSAQSFLKLTHEDTQFDRRQRVLSSLLHLGKGGYLSRGTNAFLEYFLLSLLLLL